MNGKNSINQNDLDKEFTKDWVTFCLGRYTLKAPPWVGDVYQSYQFDGYEVKVIENQNESDYRQRVAGLKHNINSLSIPSGLRSVVYKENTTQHSYLVGYRYNTKAGSQFLIKISGLVFLGNVIVVLEGETGDSYGNKYVGTQFEGELMTAEMFDKSAFRDYELAKRILNLARPIKDPASAEPGFCLGGKALIAGRPLEVGILDSLTFSNKPKEYRLVVDIYYNSKPIDNPPVYHLRDQLDRIYHLNVNGINGLARRRDDMGMEYGWASEDWSTDRDLNKPFIEIEYYEKEDYPVKNDPDLQDKIFRNILASFRLRQ